MSKIPSARLLSTSNHPVQTIYCLWAASRTLGYIPSPAQVAERMQDEESFNEEVLETFAMIVRDDIPVAENLDFVFLLENVPISLREQMVRHRIGHRFGENFGVDIIPGDVQDSWWSQSSRIIDLGTFADDENYFTPESVSATAGKKGKKNPHAIYHLAMTKAQNAYRELVEAGIPLEDARQLIPQAVCSRISWKMNYQSLKHILKRRTCWIAQLGMWKYIIHDMIEELAVKVHPVFRELAQPPCFRKDSFCGCPFVTDNIQRVKGDDPLPPCSLFMGNYGREIENDIKVEDREWFRSGPHSLTWDTEEAAKREKFQHMQEEYSNLWGRNCWTGEKE